MKINSFQFNSTENVTQGHSIWRTEVDRSSAQAVAVTAVRYDICVQSLWALQATHSSQHQPVTLFCNCSPAHNLPYTFCLDKFNTYPRTKFHILTYNYCILTLWQHVYVLFNCASRKWHKRWQISIDCNRLLSTATTVTILNRLVINVDMSSWKVAAVILNDFNQIRISSTDFSTIPPLEAESFHADG